MRKELIRTNPEKGEWCRLEVELRTDRDGKQRFSICGSHGHMIKPAQARKEALEHWISYFEEAPEEIIRMGQQCGRQFRTAKGAAKFVIESDGEYHGLDVVDEDHAGKVLVATSCGQIREEISEWFPEAVPFMKWHLNDLKAECEHQEARGESWTTHPSAECPDCGYKLGSAWKSRELPPEVVAWVDSL